MKKKTHKEYVEELSTKNPNVKVIGEYVSAKVPILHHCLLHDVYWEISPTNALQGKGCNECAKQKIGDRLRQTHEEYIEKLSVVNPYIDVLEQYIDAKTPITHRCKIDGYEWSAKPNNILSGYGCPKCAGNIKKTHDEYLIEVSTKNPNIEVLGEYMGANTPILHRCKKHNITWNCIPSDILSGMGCNICGSEKIQNKLRKNHNQYIQEVFNTNPDIRVIGRYINNKTPIEHVCLVCNYKWYTRPDGVLLGHGCPRCNETSGERQVRQWLQSKKIEYVYQKIFHDCRDKNPLPFDFYLPNYNTCIEYDGGQHFKPVNFSGNSEDDTLNQFKKIQYHDEIKTQYCKNNNISLLRIPYYKNIQEELEQFFIHLI